MRVGASILLMNGFCYQSYGWNFLRPLGKLQIAIEILDEYEVDEIVIIRPIKGRSCSESLEVDVQAIRDLRTLTPLSFGGGIRSVKEIDTLSGLPIERLCLSSAFISQDIDLIKYAIKLFGQQAIIACLPIRLVNDSIKIYHSASETFCELSNEMESFFMNYADEITLIDIDNEGLNDGFQMSLLEKINFPMNKIVVSGGVGKKVIAAAKKESISSAIIENRVLHSENSIADYR